MLNTIQKRKFNPIATVRKESAAKALQALDEINAEIAATRQESATKALEAMREMQRISALNGNSEMTLEEINAEIAAARREREEREARQA